MADPDEVLVPYGVNVLRRPGDTLVQAPRADAAQTPPAPTPQPSKNPVQPTEAPTVARPAPSTTASQVAAELSARLETIGTYRPAAFRPATRARPNAELTKLAHQHGGVIAESTPAGSSTRPETTKRTLEARPRLPRGPARAVETDSTLPRTRTDGSGPPSPKTTYHTYRRDVHLKPGQTLTFTARKGYSARNSRPGREPHAVEPVPLASAPPSGGKQIDSSGGTGTAPKRSLAVSSAPMHGRRHVPRVSGHSSPHSRVISLGPLGKAVVTLQASASVGWSGGKGKLSVAFNPRTGDLSVSDGKLTFTDPGVLSRLASGWRRDPIEARALLPTRKYEFSDEVGESTPFTVSIGGKKHEKAIVKVVNSATITIVGGAPALELKTSTTFTVKSARGQAVSIEYAITTTYKYKGPHITPEEVVAALTAAAIVYAGLSIAQSQPPPVGREP